MADPYEKLQKSIDGIASAVKDLGKASAKASHDTRGPRREPFDVDLLTSQEVEELRCLIRHEHNLAAYSSSRMQEEGTRLKGMYSEFNRIGIAVTDMNGVCVSLSPAAHWAVEKHEQRERDRRKDTRAQWRHDFRVAIASAAVGGLFGIAGTVIGVILGWHFGVS